MVFSTFTFAIFFALVAALYARLNHRWQNVMLLAASYLFYGWWDWRFLGLMILSSFVDYHVARRMTLAADPVRKKRWLILSLVVNLGLLGVFKYLGFAMTQAGSLAQLFGYEGPWWVPQVVLPVGISFYTFQSLSYTIDVYRGHTRFARHFWEFALYVAFFPQLVAGPIERSGHLLDQVAQPRQPLDDKGFEEGLYWVLTGLFRKILVADNLGLIVAAVFDRPTATLSSWEVLLGVYAFAFQIYGDFSGYSAIAKGIARWLGFSLMDNFRHPYFATSPRDFWRRWHISLSTWLRDYLFIPLGGSRGSALFVCRNLLITMILGGIWHGANWTFLAWGALHGLWLVAHRFLAGEEISARPSPIQASSASAVDPLSPFRDLQSPLRIPRLPRISLTVLMKMAVTFHVVCLGWLLFRAQEIGQAKAMLLRLGADWTVTPFALHGAGVLAAFVVPLLLFEAWVEKKGTVTAPLHAQPSARICLYALILALLIFLAPDHTSDFIYFQF
jgi:D-alanyl-lipoteichoic acid acyltransferase DltB (MBOAT superfamily)